MKTNRYLKTINTRLESIYWSQRCNCTDV